MLRREAIGEAILLRIVLTARSLLSLSWQEHLTRARAHTHKTLSKYLHFIWIFYLSIYIWGKSVSFLHRIWQEKARINDEIKKSSIVIVWIHNILVLKLTNFSLFSLTRFYLFLRLFGKCVVKSHNDRIELNSFIFIFWFIFLLLFPF